MRFLLSLPEAVHELADLDIGFFDGSGPVPDGLDGVEFYALPYGFGAAPTALIERMPNLRVVQTLTAGVEHVTPYLRPGLTLANARGVHDAATSELALALILAAQRGIGDYARAQSTGTWLKGWRPGLADARVLIVGYGAIGEAIERRLAGFEVTVERVARTARAGVRAVSELPQLLPNADIVVLITPLTADTRHLVNREFLAAMRDGALLVNVARGGIVDQDALLAELGSGRLRAALDVTDPEPLPADHPLWSAPNVLISPHVGGLSEAFWPRARRLVVDQVRRFEAGEPLHNVVM